MTKEDIKWFREQFAGKPMVIICDNEHNFFDNYPGKAFPIWDDDNERVTFIQANIEDQGRSSADFPIVISCTEYEHIQIIKVLADRETTMKYISDNAGVLGQDKTNYNKKIVAETFKNTRPIHPKYYDN